VETPEYIRSLRVVAGDLALDFVNTQDGAPEEPPGFECLQSPGDLVAWALRVGLLSEEGADRALRRARRRRADADAAYARALVLRRSLYAIFRAVALASTPPPGELTALREAESEALAHGVLTPAGGSFAWTWEVESEPAGPLWCVTHAATELLTSPRLARVKRCDACRWLFLDTSKNRSRRWCTMEECGTHEKVKRYVARRAARRSRA
jgi:predicted RNA-binding Zn ribbon-like protein